MTKDKPRTAASSPLADAPASAHLQILNVIGHGGMGVVYRAADARRNCIVAVKILHKDLCANPVFVQRFRREAQSLIELSHPNIVKGLEVDETAASVYFTMEYIDGEDLARLVSKRGPLEPALVLHIMLQAARALSYAFSKGKIHRDIKPANLLLTRNGDLKLSDFGLIKGEDDPSLTGAAPILGTPYYMSPEVVSGSPDIDIRGDIYSLGATVYHLLTGRPPFYGNEMPVVMTKQITETIEIPATVNGPGGDRFRYVISKMLSKRREMRQQTPDELLADLEKLSAVGDLAVGPIPAPRAVAEPAAPSTAALFSAPTVEAYQPRLTKMIDVFQLAAFKESAPQTRTFSSGAVLFYEGDGSRDFYVLNSGKCEVLRSGKRLAIIEDPGATFGEMSVILGGRRTATIRTLTTTVCTIIPPEEFMTFLAENPKLQQQVMSIALTRLQDLNERYVRSQNAVGRAKLALLRTIRHMAFSEPEELVGSLQSIYNLMAAPED